MFIVPAGIRKTGPWVVCLSGIVDTQASTNQFYLDRQANMSVFHSKLGLIISGANSKRQPELATFTEKIKDQMYHMPISSRLRMSEARDRLGLDVNQKEFFLDAKLEIVGHGPPFPCQSQKTCAPYAHVQDCGEIRPQLGAIEPVHVAAQGDQGAGILEK